MPSSIEAALDGGVAASATMPTSASTNINLATITTLAQQWLHANPSARITLEPQLQALTNNADINKVVEQLRPRPTETKV